MLWSNCLLPLYVFLVLAGKKKLHMSKYASFIIDHEKVYAIRWLYIVVIMGTLKAHA